MDEEERKFAQALLGLKPWVQSLGELKLAFDKEAQMYSDAETKPNWKDRLEKLPDVLKAARN